jgi:hypothetical protein
VLGKSETRLGRVKLHHLFTISLPQRDIPSRDTTAGRERKCSVAEKCHEFVCRHVSFHSALRWEKRSNLCLGAGKYDVTHFLSATANIRGRIGQGSRGARPGLPHPFSAHRTRASKSATGKSPFCAAAKSDRLQHQRAP